MNMDVNAIKNSSRGRHWFGALTDQFQAVDSGIASLLIADGQLNGIPTRVFCVVNNEQNLYPRARQGEVGLLEGWSLARAVDQVIEADQDRAEKRGILCIVDVPSQAYGRREEVLGIHQALAGAVDSYARARLAGHPIVSLLVGKSMSGAFLAHGYQANRILALKDQGVMVHAMGKESAARVTLRTVEELERLAANIPPMAYDIESYNSLGLLSDILDVSNADQPSVLDIQQIQQALTAAFADIKQQGTHDLKHRLNAENRSASKRVRELLREQWS
ncbi:MULTISPECIES: biotin-independent malonate decarboxylase subunit gamma [Acinetobacter]|uniref:biotin-independent malonate decarboxylase subunit gamma n=1 Tax=Acinetobacter TaxID=469 RepID=UPI000235E435|nr:MULTISPECIES: biotin-independent malonate decarboxylase subunit gamma [Acinetobacter]KXZ75207.1 Malonyl-S-ACP:biotin-protein carboxyltransferase MADD [Acinetobacter venetianus]GAB01706.1 malonate decarboxylase gamma subunit [Acinetobacter sp. NBRC 100985]